MSVLSGPPAGELKYNAITFVRSATVNERALETFRRSWKRHTGSTSLNLKIQFHSARKRQRAAVHNHAVMRHRLPLRAELYLDPE